MIKIRCNFPKIEHPRYRNENRQTEWKFYSLGLPAQYKEQLTNPKKLQNPYFKGELNTRVPQKVVKIQRNLPKLEPPKYRDEKSTNGMENLLFGPPSRILGLKSPKSKELNFRKLFL